VALLHKNSKNKNKSMILNANFENRFPDIVNKFSLLRSIPVFKTKSLEYYCKNGKFQEWLLKIFL